LAASFKTTRNNYYMCEIDGTLN